MSAPSVPSFPLLLYLYNEQGCHGDPIEIPDAVTLETAMRIMVQDHIRHGLEVRITNLSDELVFHAQNGKIIWPPREGPLPEVS